MELVRSDDPILRKVLKEVESVTPELVAKAREMVELCNKAGGIGLAANQVGLTERMFVEYSGQIYINPRILELGGKVEELEEGCLSFPGHKVKIPRATECLLEFLNAEGKREQRRLFGLFARMAQHEIDHLNGKVIVDHGKRSKSKKR